MMTLKEIEWLRAEWTKESKAHIDRIEAMEMAVNDARVLILKNTSAMNRASDRIEALEAAIRMLIDNIETGSYESTGQAIESARAALALEQDA